MRRSPQSPTTNGYAASSSARYRYTIARQMPKDFAMSLPVWKSALIRLAVAKWSMSSTLQGRLRPRCRWPEMPHS